MASINKKKEDQIYRLVKHINQDCLTWKSHYMRNYEIDKIKQMQADFDMMKNEMKIEISYLKGTIHVLKETIVDMKTDMQNLHSKFNNTIPKSVSGGKVKRIY